MFPHHQAIYPDVPIEVLVSIGTGFIKTGETGPMSEMGWDALANTLVCSSTDTEDVHGLIKDLMPENKYYRFSK